MRWSATRGMMLNNIIAIMAGVSKKKYITATGGTITRDGNFLVHTFTGSDNLVITQTSNDPTYNSLEYLIVAGGGGGGGFAYGGGAGAGGLLTGAFTPAVGSLSVVVGSGGNGGPNTSPSVPSNGSDSVFNSLTAIGGGYGGSWVTVYASVGGSGGGAGPSSVPRLGAAGTPGQGNNGGMTNIYGGGECAAGGGGGAGSVGQDGTSSTKKGGDGGIGYSSNISGTSKYYAGGGAGGSGDTGGTGGLGGLGGGGNAGGHGTPAQNGTVNTGGGGGGATYSPSQAGANGGSGIVIVRYYNPINTLTTGLYASYNFEGNANDLSGNGYNGTLVNSPTFSSGKFLQGVNFNGSNYISTATSTFNPSGDFSLSIWIKPSSFVSFMGILDKFTFGGVPAGWGLDIPLAGMGFQNPRFTINTTIASYSVSGITSISTTTWTNIICIFSSNTIYIYKNGTLENQSTTNGTLVAENQALFIGGDNASTLLYNGSLDAFNFWTRALTPTEISTLQNFQNPFY